jgi:hypothetical protein
MGAVYLAELANGTPGPKFALKIVRFPSPDLARRLVEETRILSRLDHPNIARLLDAGTTADGLPYLAIEYVEGVPIHRYCESLPPDAIVGLLRDVCSAVKYLHQNLVVHRDLKPANILVTANGVVKVVDFGIAKLIDPSPGLEAKGLTLGPLTPEYASPEQIRNGPVSTLTDVFTLGIVLYELLTRTKPFDGSVIEVLNKIANQDAVRPSARDRRVPTDLDSVVLHAMEREPERRYASIEQMDEDLRRYLDGLPVLARRGSVWYKARKFVVRNKAGVAGAMAALVLLIAGVVATQFQARRAESERARAEAQAKAASAAQLQAQLSAMEALRQKTDAERRLKQLEQLAQGAVRAYEATVEPSPANSQFLASHVQEALLMLGREKPMIGSAMERVFDNAAADLRSRELAVRQDWELPAGWTAEGSRDLFRIGLDRVFKYQGKSTYFLRSLTPDTSVKVSLLREFQATAYRGKRVRFSAITRAEKIERNAALGIGSQGVELGSQPISGTTGWTHQSVIVDIPSNAETIIIGASLSGPGTLWISGFDFRQVDR